MKPTLTVFTCTYNRAYTIHRTYRSLCRQTCMDFMWLIVDDGSTDNTKELVEQWEKEGIIPVKYVYKENGGLHTGYNKAIELMDTELCVCIDSDDWMPDDAVDIILTEWPKCKKQGLIGIIGRDYYPNNKMIGLPFPPVESAYVIELMDKFNHSGDKKLVMRVDLLKKTPAQPTYNGEKNFNPIYRILQLDQYGRSLLLEKNLCYVDYQDTGMAANIFKQFVNSPNSFCALRSLYISLDYTTWRFKIKNLLHLASSSIIANDFVWLRKCKYPILAHLMIPFGYLLSKYIRNKV